MATLVLGTVGFVAGGPLGASIGASIGNVIDRQLLAPSGPDQTREGPRLSDLAVQTSNYGAPIPLAYGTTRIAGNVIWSSGLIERQQETSSEVSGGKGGGSQTVTDVRFVYFASFAVGLSGRPIAGIGRIWADGKLLRDASGVLAVPGSLRIYKGNESQQPDPLIEAAEGVDNAPAFRGLSYLVFEELALGEFGNRIPNLSVEVMAANGSESIAVIAQDLAQRAGGVEIDAKDVGISVPGFVVAGPTPARTAFEDIGAAFPFSSAESDGQIRIRRLDTGTTKTVAETDIGARPFSDRGGHRHLRQRRRQELELPRAMVLHFFDSDRDYQTGAQRAQRQTSLSVMTEQRSLPMTMTADQAKGQAEIALALSWSQRTGIGVSLPIDFTVLDPGDRVTVTEAGVPATYLIRDMQIDAGFVQVSADAFPDGVLQAGAIAGNGQIPGQTIETPGPTQFDILDLPVGRGSQRDRLFAAAAGTAPGWRGASVFLSEDNGASYTPVTGTKVAQTMGQTTTALPGGPTAYWDKSSQVNVDLLRSDMALESRPELAILNGANRAVIGDEVVQFQDATLEPDGSYTLSGLLRGREGTEAAIDSHGAGERFVLLSGPTMAIEPELSHIGRSTLVKAVSTDSTLDDTAAMTFTYSGRALRPLAPVHLQASRNSQQDVTIQWIRRSRIDGGWIDGTEVPLGEESERYEVEVLDETGNAKRVLSTTAPETVYTAADQTADFGTPQSAINVRIYQISAHVGRGSALTGTV